MTKNLSIILVEHYLSPFKKKKRNNKKCCEKSHFVEVENLEKLPILAMKFHKIINFFMLKRNFEKLK
jgi:hypothetical protein